jgi:hypothetical protein
VEGVVQNSAEDLARTLRALQAEYEASDAARRLRIRKLVMEAREHCRWSLRRLHDDVARAEEKQEAFLWMTTWLENPVVFEEWLRLRWRRGSGDGRPG